MKAHGRAAIRDARYAKSERMVGKLRDYHSLGRKLAQEGASTAEVSQKYKLNVSTIRKARAFAAQYTLDELEELCALRRPDGSSFHWGYVPYLLTIPWGSARERKVRSSLQRKAARNGWTAPEFYAEIKKRFPGNRREGVGGRAAKLPIDPATLLGEVARLLERVEVRYHLHGEHDESLPPKWLKIVSSTEWRDLQRRVRELLASAATE